MKFGAVAVQAIRRAWRRRSTTGSTDSGFTLVELLVVTVILPIVVGALALALVTVFTLQSGVQARLTNSADSQQVESTFANDIASSQNVTTASTSSPQCGSGIGTQLLGLEWNENPTTHQYATVVSYVSVPVTVGSKTTYSLLRLYCGSVPLNPPTVITPTSQITLSNNISAATAITPATIVPASQVTPAAAGWVASNTLINVALTATEPGTTNGTGQITYTVTGAPASVNPIAGSNGGPITSSSTSSCGFAYSGSGPYAGNLCFIDFSYLTGNALTNAETGCDEASISIPGGDTMFFCLGISGAPVSPYSLPTWPGGFLGNSGTNAGSQTGITPNYYNITNAGGGVSQPALYQSCEGSNVSTTPVIGNVDGCTANGSSPDGVTTLTLSNITILQANGLPAANWQLFSADAESTDPGESIVWSTGANGPVWNVLNNGYSWDTSSDPVGEACGSAQVNGVTTYATGLTGSGTNTVTCNGNGFSGTKTGTVIATTQQPSKVTLTITGAGLEGVSFGVYL